MVELDCEGRKSRREAIEFSYMRSKPLTRHLLEIVQIDIYTADRGKHVF